MEDVNMQIKSFSDIFVETIFHEDSQISYQCMST